MELSARQKSWLVENCDVAKDATNDEFLAAAAKALIDGIVTPEKWAELGQEEKSADSDVRLDTLLDTMKGLTDAVSKMNQPAAPAEPADKDETKETPADEKSWLDTLKSNLTDTSEVDVRVKGAWENYNTTKSALAFPSHTKSGRPHPHAGQPVKRYSDSNETIDESSELEKAVSGAWAKFLCSTIKHGGMKSLGFHALPEHDKELIYYAMDHMKWGGATDGGNYADINNRKLSAFEQKALIDDATSGGLEAAPIVFDDDVIQTPLLHGELYPLVSVRPIDRGRRIEGVSTGTVTASWGGIDDTSIALFNTASYVSAFDTTIHRWEGSIQIGLDFLSDTPIDFGAHVTSQYGERLLEDLDDVIAAGNGSTQPEGIINKSGYTSVAWGGTTSLGNYESLRFGVPKNEHRPNLLNSAVFVGTETSYQRARALPVGASDARRLGGMDYSSYRWMERDYKINESLTNQQIAYVLLGRYRMYQRRGLTLRSSTEGDTLIRKNNMLIAATARFGGQLERGAVAAITTTAPA